MSDLSSQELSSPSFTMPYILEGHGKYIDSTRLHRHGNELLHYAIQLRRSGLFDSAQLIADSSQRIFLALRDSHQLASSINQLGLIHLGRGDFHKAFEALSDARQISQQLRDSVNLIKYTNNIAAVYEEVQEHALMKEQLLRAEALAKAIGNKAWLQKIAINLGNTYQLLEQRDSALFYTQKAVKLGEQYYLMDTSEDNRQVLQMALNNLGNLFLQEENFLPAEQYLRQAQALVNTETPSSLESLILGTLADVYLFQQQPARALPFIQKACQLSQQSNFLQGLLNCEKKMSHYYELQGDSEQQVLHLKKWQQLNDSIYSIAKIKTIQGARFRQELNSKEQEITYLIALQKIQQERFRQRRNSIIAISVVLSLLLLSLLFTFRARSRARLVQQEKEISEHKLALLRSQMNPHFIYNAFSSIQNFILKSEKIEAYNYLGKFASLLRQVMNNAEQTDIQLDQEVNLLKNYIELERIRFRHKFSCRFTVDPILEQLNPRIPSMMLQPYVENAILHGLSNRMQAEGLLVIRMTKQDKLIICEIEDNGIGRVKAKQISQRQANQHLSMASENGANRLVYMQKIGYHATKIKIEDLYSKHEACGTKVTIHLPIISSSYESAD